MLAFTNGLAEVMRAMELLNQVKTHLLFGQHGTSSRNKKIRVSKVVSNVHFAPRAFGKTAQYTHVKKLLRAGPLSTPRQP